DATVRVCGASLIAELSVALTRRQTRLAVCSHFPVHGDRFESAIECAALRARAELWRITFPGPLLPQAEVARILASEVGQDAAPPCGALSITDALRARVGGILDLVGASKLCRA